MGEGAGLDCRRLASLMCPTGRKPALALSSSRLPEKAKSRSKGDRWTRLVNAYRGSTAHECSVVCKGSIYVGLFAPVHLAPNVSLVTLLTELRT